MTQPEIILLEAIAPFIGLGAIVWLFIMVWEHFDK